MSSLIRVVPLLTVAILTAAGGAARAGGDCQAPPTGFVPLIDLPPALHGGAQGGLYPGESNLLPAAHEAAADRAARVLLRDAAGSPDETGGAIVLLSIGMSNTSREFGAFIQTADPQPDRNPQLVLVNGAQGAWDSVRLADPAQNATFYETVDQLLAGAGVTPAQVGAVWLKQAEGGPSLAFPADAEVLQADIATILRDLKVRYPNLAQAHLSSRIYAGYAVVGLNPEPFAYQSSFALKWMIEDQIDGDPALAFDASQGNAVAPWLAWGPYLWADGEVPRSDGLTWSCDELDDDGTHPSARGTQKVADLLLAFYLSDPVASRWFADCDPADSTVFASPPAVRGLSVTRSAGVDVLDWEDLGPAAGPGTRHDVLSGTLADLRTTGDTSLGVFVLTGLPSGPVLSPVPDPLPGEGVYYLVRGDNGCGVGPA